MVDIAWHVPAGVETRRFDRDAAELGTAQARTAQVTTRSTGTDYSDQALLLGRLKSGTARESQRVTHVFEMAPELTQSPVIAARCGVRLAACDLQWLPRFAGMPCERCVMAA